jgi:hypothetical protein
LPPNNAPPERVVNLSLEELSLTFRVLARQMPVQELPPRLQHLRPEDWAVLDKLLSDLQAQRVLESLH